MTPLQAQLLELEEPFLAVDFNQEHLWGTRKYFRNDFRAFLPANHELRRDRRFGTPCLEPRPAAKVDAFMRVHGAAMAKIDSDKDAKEERLQKHGVKGMHVPTKAVDLTLCETPLGRFS
eukprot:g34033.t1